MTRKNFLTLIILVSLLLLAASPPPETPTPAVIRLQYATFDPLLDGVPAVPANLSAPRTAPDAPGLYIVQFEGVVSPAEKTALTNLGAAVESYLPENALLVRLTPTAATAAAQLNGVRWVGDFQPAYKLSPRIAPDTARLRLALASWADAAAVKDALATMGIAAGGNGKVLIISASAAQLPAVAQRPDVLWIEPFTIPQLFNDQAAGIMNVTTAWTSGYTGTGQIVTIADTGIDTGKDVLTQTGDIHLDFDNRLAHISSWAVQNYSGITNVGTDDGADDVDSGHGTHVTGSVGGNGARSSGTIKGSAYGATLTMQAIEQWTTFSDGTPDGYYLTGIPADLNTLFLESYNWGARIHTNSWGSDVSGDYTTDSQNVDNFIWNHPDFTILFAAGNAGTDGNSDGYVDEGSVGAPATAKNVISIGASDNVRASGGYQFTWSSGWSSDYPANPTASDYISDSAEEMAAFSSTGPTTDGRIKPDLVAPGTNILSTRSSQTTASGWGTYNSYYMYNSGTSMATPLAAGAATVLRGYLVDSGKVANPSAAMVKAVLINTAVDIGGYGVSTKEAGQPIPNNHEGWGRIDIGAAISDTGRAYYDNASLTTGNSDTYTFTITGTVSALKATLVWSDYPGSTTAATQLVNNLNLVVTAPNGSTTYLGNVFSGGWSTTGGTADAVNNVENVYVKNPVTGTWTIRVSGASVPQGPQPYALVVDGGKPASPPPVLDKFVYLPLILKNAGNSSTTPYGTITDQGSPVAGTTVLLRYYDGTSWSTYASTTTDASGKYQFSSVPTLSDTQGYYVRWDNTTNDNTRLLDWICFFITSNTPNFTQLQCSFDIQNIDMISPSSGATVSLPQTFSWQKRTTTSDNYEWNLMDTTNGSPWWDTGQLGYNGSYTLNTLPNGFSINTQYGWHLWVYGDNGYGRAYYYRTVTFSNTGNRVEMKRTPTAAPLPRDDEFIRHPVEK